MYVSEQTLAFIVMGSILAFVGLFVLISKARIIWNGKSTDAVVVRTVQGSVGRSGWGIYPVLKYKANGKSYTIEHNIGRSWQKYSDETL